MQYMCHLAIHIFPTESLNPDRIYGDDPPDPGMAMYTDPREFLKTNFHRRRRALQAGQAHTKKCPRIPLPSKEAHEVHSLIAPPLRVTPPLLARLMARIPQARAPIS